MKLVLFDIDGTLLDSGGAGTKALNLAFEEVFSIRDAFRGIAMAGKTDIQILKEGLRGNGLDSENGDIAVLCDSYIRNLTVEIENPRRHLKPGVRESLAILAGLDDVILGLLTGNIEAGARIKLDPFGLNSFFSFGAFGNDNEDRNMLLPVAIERLKRLYGREVEFKGCVVIGDTPRDVECAKVHGAAAIAVATGPYPYESLVRSGADMVLMNLSEMDYTFLRD